VSALLAETQNLWIGFVRHFGAAAGNLYDHPQVEAILTEGRTFIRRTPRRFDVILLGFVDSWAAVASGGLSLSENHLYTVEAFQAYYDHLTPGGLLVILRWDVDVPRLVTNSVAFLGAEEAGKRIAVLMEKERADGDPSQMAFLLKKAPFTDAETAKVAEWTKTRPLVLPGRGAGQSRHSHVITCACKQDIAEQTVFTGQSQSINTSCDDPLPCAHQRTSGDGGYE
jgi:hypothetical protein